ncbi:hypothetical protein ACPCG0_09625 [Propionibacteriaceae bacterium Y1923]
MKELRIWWDHVWTMGHDAVTLWWRVLPKVVGVTMVGYVLSQVCMVVAAKQTGDHPWGALVLLALGLIFTLSAVIISLQIMGRDLGIHQELPPREDGEEREQSLSRSVAVTLLPFLGIYAAFDYIQDIASLLIAYEIILNGLFSGGILQSIQPDTAEETRRMIIIIVGAYIVRRLVDLLHEKTGFRPLGLVAALIEAFFLLLLVFLGQSLLSQWLWRLRTTRLAAWWAETWEGFTGALGRVHALLPALADWVVGFFSWLWPVFTHAFVQPVMWLAVAALVFGSHVLSFAEMWRKGEPLTAHLDAESEVVIDKRGRRRENAGTTGRAVIVEVQEALFGDLNDKYLPTFQSLRLVLRGGVLFLGAYVFIYSLFSVVSRGFKDTVLEVFGGRAATFWVAWDDLITGLTQPFGETLRLALLAVAFRRVLTHFRNSADPSAVRPEHREQLLEAQQAATAAGVPLDQIPQGQYPAQPQGVGAWPGTGGR